MVSRSERKKAGAGGELYLDRLTSWAESSVGQTLEAPVQFE